MAKELKSKKMRDLLTKAVRKAKRQHPPGDGNMRNLVYEHLRNGWHYQVEWVHDTRLKPKPWIVAYAFPPHSSRLQFRTILLDRRLIPLPSPWQPQ